jgi:hypothetical protein
MYKLIIFSFYSYDTEALNKPTIENCDENLFDQNNFANTFEATPQNKINIGIQQLYLIGNKYY